MSAMQLTIPDDVRDKARQVAQDEHMSLDEFTTLALVQRLSTCIPDPYLEMRAKRGNPRRFKEILAQAPNVPPDDGDRLD